MKAAPGGKSDDEVDALFRLPLAEFTGARNALAARWKKAERREDADRVKALPKPSVPAWVANQIFWNHRDALARLMEATRRFKQAQAAQLSGKPAGLRETLEGQRKALADITGLAVSTLREADALLSPDLLRRVTSTLDALSAGAAGPDAPRAGRLTHDLQPAGFETLTALVPQAGGTSAKDGPSRLLRFTSGSAAQRTNAAAASDPKQKEDERQRQAAAAKAAVRDAQRVLAGAQRAARKAEVKLKAEAAAASEAEARKAAALRQMERAGAAADAARQKARRVAAAAEEAAQLVADAERALEAARQHAKQVE